MANGLNTTQGAIAAYDDYNKMIVAADQVRVYLPAPAQTTFDDFIVLKPASFWSPVYLKQLAQLSEAIYLMGRYQALETEEMTKKKPNLDVIEDIQKKVNVKLTVVKHLQNLLQLTPTQTNGVSRDVNKGTELTQQMREINESGTDLYA